MHDVGRFLNRLLGLPPDIQNRCLLYIWVIFICFPFLFWYIHILTRWAVQVVRVICQHPWCNHQEGADWRKSWFWDCWHKSKYCWTSRKTKGSFPSTPAFLKRKIYLLLASDKSIWPPFLVDCVCRSNVWCFYDAVHIYSRSWDDMGGNFSVLVWHANTVHLSRTTAPF